MEPEKVNPFTRMMKKEARMRMNQEVNPFKCPHCPTRKATKEALEGHWYRMSQENIRHGGVMPTVVPSAGSGMRLSQRHLDLKKTMENYDEYEESVVVKQDPHHHRRIPR